jgi:hypothetical protein
MVQIAVGFAGEAFGRTPGSTPQPSGPVRPPRYGTVRRGRPQTGRVAPSLPAPDAGPRQCRNQRALFSVSCTDPCQRAPAFAAWRILSRSITVAAYVEQHPGSPATIKQHMSAIRMLFSWLTEKGILAMNPAREVKLAQTKRYRLFAQRFWP